MQAIRGDQLRHSIKVLAAAVIATAAFASSAAEIVLERSGVEKLVTQALFKDRGRLVLARSPCTSYLDQPSVTLADGRVRIRAHLSALVGFVVNGDCAGVSLASWAVISGRPSPAGGSLRLEDIRIDSVDDADTRSVLKNAGFASLLPRAVQLDVQGAVQSMLLQSVNQLQATIESFDFQEAAIVGDRLSMKFEFRLVGR